MALFSVSDDWTLELGEDFEQHVEDGSMVLSQDDRSVWIDVMEDERSREEKLAYFQGDVPDGVKVWRFEQENLLKFGYLEHDTENENYELMTFSLSESQYAIIVFYFDEESSLDWALKRWRSVRFDVVE